MSEIGRDNSISYTYFQLTEGKKHLHGIAHLEKRNSPKPDDP